MAGLSDVGVWFCDKGEGFVILISFVDCVDGFFDVEGNW